MRTTRLPLLATTTTLARSLKDQLPNKYKIFSIKRRKRSRRSWHSNRSGYRSNNSSQTTGRIAESKLGGVD